MIDDSIWRDYHTAAEWVQAWWATIEPWLISDMALRIYVLLAACLVLGLSVLIAFRIKNELEDIADDIFVVTRRGRPPRKPKSVEEAIKKLQAFREAIWRRYAWHIIVFGVCGFLIPTLTLYLGTAFYEWFVPNQKPLLISTTKAIIDIPTSDQLWTFVLNQLSHGALNDYPEVFGREYGDVTNNPDNIIFSSMVVVYRFIVGAFGLVFPLFFGRAMILAIRMPPAKKLFSAHTKQD